MEKTFEEIETLRQNNKFQEVFDAFNKVPNIENWLRRLNLSEISSWVTEWYLAAYYSGDMDLAVEVVKNLKLGLIEEETLENTDFLLQHLQHNKKVVATTDTKRQPKEDEIVIIYGNYPLLYQNLVVCNPVKRHLRFFNIIQHHHVEYHPCWELVGQIYIVNLREREDRYFETLRELARMGAPLNRVNRWIGEKINETGDRSLDGAIGAGMSHLEICQDAQQKGFENILILEDDFTFTDDIEDHQQHLSQLLTQHPNYWICLLSWSRFWPLIELNDLVSINNQQCSTTSGYLVSKAGLDQLIPVYQEGLEGLRQTGDGLTYCCDRYWYKLCPSPYFLVFKHKMGFQRPSYSNRISEVEFNMD